MAKRIQFYGAMWCGDCRRAKNFLDGHGIAYEVHDTDNQKGARKKMMEVNGGIRSIPTIVFPNGSFLIEPTDTKLAKALNIDKS